MSIVMKGETRMLVDPDYVLKTLKRLDAKHLKTSEGVDTYFDKELFESGRHFRVRKQPVYEPKETVNYFIHVKDHEPDYKKMNVYRTYALPQQSDVETIKTLKVLGYKPIFLEKWTDCKEFELNNTKVEIFKLVGWGWLMELEGVLEGQKHALYSRLVETLGMMGLEESNLTNEEPATHLFRKKYGSNSGKTATR
jgi:adenylate cyclase class IV